MEQYMWIIWLSIFVIALIVESLGSEVVSVWFAFGAVISLILSFIPNVAWWIQIIVFLVVSIATMVALRPFIRRLMKHEIVNSNIDTMIHKKGKMTKACDNLNHGEVRINGVTWTAVSADENRVIKENEIVEVIAIEGNKLIVK